MKKKESRRIWRKLLNERDPERLLSLLVLMAEDHDSIHEDYKAKAPENNHEVAALGDSKKVDDDATTGSLLKKGHT